MNCVSFELLAREKYRTTVWVTKKHVELRTALLESDNSVFLKRVRPYEMTLGAAGTEDLHVVNKDDAATALTQRETHDPQINHAELQ